MTVTRRIRPWDLRGMLFRCNHVRAWSQRRHIRRCMQQDGWVILYRCHRHQYTGSDLAACGAPGEYVSDGRQRSQTAPRWAWDYETHCTSPTARGILPANHRHSHIYRPQKEGTKCILAAFVPWAGAMCRAKMGDTDRQTVKQPANTCFMLIAITIVIVHLHNDVSQYYLYCQYYQYCHRS